MDKQENIEFEKIIKFIEKNLIDDKLILAEIFHIKKIHSQNWNLQKIKDKELEQILKKIKSKKEKDYVLNKYEQQRFYPDGGAIISYIMYYVNDPKFAYDLLGKSKTIKTKLKVFEERKGKDKLLEKQINETVTNLEYFQRKRDRTLTQY